MVGSFAAALGPAAFLFLRPMRVVGCGGGSYFGLSFYRENGQYCELGGEATHAIFLMTTQMYRRKGRTLSFLSFPSPGGPPPALDC